jgi:hypothetical protein
MSTIQHHLQGFEAHLDPVQCPKECYDGTWHYKQGQRVHWKGNAHGKDLQGVGTIVGLASATPGAMQQWIVQLSEQDAPQMIPGGYHCNVFFSYCLRPVAEA